MNSLSWLIYFGSVSGSGGNLCGFLAVASFIATMAGAVFYFSYTLRDDQPRVKEATLINEIGRKILRASIPTFFICATLSVLLPDKNTVYAIAASQIGEKVVNAPELTDLSKEALTTLKDWLKKQQDKK